MIDIGIIAKFILDFDASIKINITFNMKATHQYT